MKWRRSDFGVLNSEIYYKRFLGFQKRIVIRHYWPPYVEKLWTEGAKFSKDILFLQDNASAHKSHVFMQRFRDFEYDLLEQPPNSKEVVKTWLAEYEV